MNFQNKFLYEKSRFKKGRNLDNPQFLLKIYYPKKLKSFYIGYINHYNSLNVKK
jgi:hypothetical protein